MCIRDRYRSNLFGFEKEVGLVQESHHHHVEGIGISCELCDHECNGACENNDLRFIDAQDQIKKTNNDQKHNQDDHHHHNIYPNSKHPLGPVTLRLLNKDQILRNSVEKS